MSVFLGCYPEGYHAGCLREGSKKEEESVTFSALGRRVGGGGGSPKSHSLGDFFAAQKTFLSLKKAPKLTLCSLLTSDMLDIASSSMLKISCIISGTSVADTRKW